MAGAAVSLGGLLAACGGGGSTGAGAAAATTGQSASARSSGARGGTFKVGIVGNGTEETFSPIQANSEIDLAHTVQIFEPVEHFNTRGLIEPFLAEEVTPNASLDEWTIRLRPEVEFHNGKTLSAADVMYTYNFNLDPKNGSVSTSNLLFIKSMKVVDDRTLKITLKRPNRFFGPSLVDFHHGIFPVGTTLQDLAKNPIGTGPFKLVKFTPGQRAELARHENYWQHGKPYVDALQIISIDDPEARVNALLSHQVDAIADASPVQIPSIESAGFQVLENKSSGWMGNSMWTSGKGASPFDQVEVRQALRLLVDREQVKENAFLGHAELANDLYGIQDPFYPDLPQRTYDPEQAKGLLKKIGMENLTVDLYTGNLTNGLLEFDTLFAQSAKAGGVTINLHSEEPGRYFTTSYLKQPFGSTYWSGNPYYQTATQTLTPAAPLNETAWHDKEWVKLFEEATVAKNGKLAEEILGKTQEILYERGGYIIPVFPNFLDAVAQGVTGTQPSPVYPLGYFDFRQVSVG
ncbi:MAG: ABC transporter substrate-binding protein [Actinobacteria bacterium]|nr:ABC transporter substrate-binding protein [Actinomycetota bacterium]